MIKEKCNKRNTQTTTKNRLIDHTVGTSKKKPQVYK